MILYVAANTKLTCITILANSVGSVLSGLRDSDLQMKEMSFPDIFATSRTSNVFLALLQCRHLDCSAALR